MKRSYSSAPTRKLTHRMYACGGLSAGAVALAAGVGIRETRVMRSRRHRRVRPAPSSAFAGYRFPPEVITLAVRWYQRFAPEFAEAARARQHVIGDRWHVDETYVKVGGDVAVPVPGHRPVRLGHRRLPLTSPGRHDSPPLPRASHRSDPNLARRGHHRSVPSLSSRAR